MVQQAIKTLTNGHIDPMKVYQALATINLQNPNDKTAGQELLNKLGNDGFESLISTVKEIVSIDHQANLAQEHHTTRVADIMHIIYAELTEALTI